MWCKGWPGIRVQLIHEKSLMCKGTCWWGHQLGWYHYQGSWLLLGSLISYSCLLIEDTPATIMSIKKILVQFWMSLVDWFSKGLYNVPIATAPTIFSCRTFFNIVWCYVVFVLHGSRKRKTFIKWNELRKLLAVYRWPATLLLIWCP
jgi:hypothetical protein